MEEGAGETDGTFAMLYDAGFVQGQAMRLASHPNASRERVKALIEEASKPGNRIKDPKAFIAAGIRDGWSPKPFVPLVHKEPKLQAGRWET